MSDKITIKFKYYFRLFRLSRSMSSDDNRSIQNRLNHFWKFSIENEWNMHAHTHTHEISVIDDAIWFSHGTFYREIQKSGSSEFGKC